MLKRIIMAVVLLGGCFGGNTLASERFHSIEKLCIVYEMAGQLVNGTVTRCHRKYAYEWFEIQNFKAGFGGFTQNQDQHSIAIAEKLYVIDLVRGTGTVSKNPMYQPFKDAIARNGNSPEAIAGAFFNAMGFAATGQTKVIAGFTCSVMVSQSVGNGCFTKDFVMLEQSFLGNRQKATEINIGVDGGDDNYTLWQKVSLSEGVDLSNGIDFEALARQLRERRKNQGNQPQGLPKLPEGVQVPEGLQDLLKQLQPQ